MTWELVSLRIVDKTLSLLRSSTPKVHQVTVVPALQTLQSNSAKGNGLKGDENVVLADALNLLSPKYSPPPPPPSKLTGNKSYKPSIFNHLTSGPLHEQQQFLEANIDKLLLATLPDQTVNQKSVTDHLDHLLAGIHSSTSPIPASDPAPLDLLSASPKNLLFYIKGLKNEKTLVKVYELFYYNNALTPKIMMDIILNKHLVNLSKIPMIDQISNYLTSPSSQNRLAIKLGVINDWNKFDFVQLNIILLKKYHDLKKPLLIIRNLKAYFESTYYPLIEMASDNTLSPFYERIVWKFYFEYLLNDEQYYIQRLNRLSSTVIIWESSLPNKSMEIMENALSFHKQDLNHPLQMSFFKLCSSQMTNTLVREELGKASHKSVSPTLSMLKQLSIKYKPYTFTKMSTTSDSRSILYQFIQDMESIILDEFLTNKQTTTGVESESILELMELYKDIIKFKETELMKIQRDEKDDVHDWVAAGSHTFALDK